MCLQTESGEQNEKTNRLRWSCRYREKTDGCHRGGVVLGPGEEGEDNEKCRLEVAEGTWEYEEQIGKEYSQQYCDDYVLCQVTLQISWETPCKVYDFLTTVLHTTHWKLIQNNVEYI